MLRTLAIENYRSLRHLVLPLTSLNVVTGANGSGKSSLYRALRLDALRRASAKAGTELTAIELTKDLGETRVLGREVLDQPAWHWPKR